MASSAIPGLCRPIYIDGIPYYDGAPGDPVPVEKAFEMGCDKVVLILTMPEDTLRTPYKDQTMVRFVQRKFPETAKVLRERASKYNRSIELAKQYRTEGKLLIIAPDDTCGVHTLCRDSFKMRRLYGKGYVDAEKITPFLLG
jgi:predicted patatin/cPLA2 family phospholipase